MELHKILIIRFSSIGDVALVAPAVAAIKARYPQAEIHLLTKKAMAPVWSGDTRVRVRFYDGDDAHFGLPGFRKFITELRAEHFDAVVDLHALPKSRMLAWAIGENVMRYQKNSLARRFYVATKILPNEPVHTARRYVRALAPLGIDTEAPLDARIDAAETARNRVGNMVQAVGLRGRSLVALAPGSQWATKQWGWVNFAELVNRLHARGDWVALVGGKADRDRCEELAAGKRALNFAGLLDLQETLALMDYCKLLVTNDSGPMHLAGARQTDVIAIFGSTTRALGFWPLAPKFSVLEVDDLECRPCAPHGRDACPKGHFRCMHLVSVNRVWAEVEKYLGPPPSDDKGPEDNEGVFFLGSQD